jgi:hypothetical protein
MEDKSQKAADILDAKGCKIIHTMVSRWCNENTLFTYICPKCTAQCEINSVRITSPENFHCWRCHF